MEVVRLIILFSFLAVVTALILLIIISNEYVVTDFGDVTHSWKVEPIVSIYIPPDYLNSNCKADYEPILAYNTIKGISKGPCACTENILGILSSSSSCDVNQEQNPACMSLNSLPQVKTVAWRDSVICVKHDGESAASNHNKYRGRPHPDPDGHCPEGYKKCGKGLTQQEGAICFPNEVECPITNLLILPSGKNPLTNESWERAGEFTSNYSLFVRREFLNELPITTITFRLTELSSKAAGHNKRGQCYKRFTDSDYFEDFEKVNQVVNSTLVADRTKLLSYDVALPPVCEVSDPRYTLVDQVPLQDHFLHNLPLNVPACKTFTLYPLSDPRYEAARDPDYLNSGVKCGSVPHYKCVRDQYQHTDCGDGDDICDGVINQNVCGAYAHAVRSAFSDYKSKGVTLGMYFSREVQWADWCSEFKKTLFHTQWIRFEMVVVKMALCELWIVYNFMIATTRCCKVRFSCDWCVFPLVIAVMYVLALTIAQLSDVYDVVGSGDCTDAFTRDTIQDRLEYAKDTHYYAVLAIQILVVLSLDAAVMTCVMNHRHHLTVTEDGAWHYVPQDAVPNLYSAVATVEDTVVNTPVQAEAASLSSATAPLSEGSEIELSDLSEKFV